MLKEIPGLSFLQFKPQGTIQAVSVYVRNIKKCMGILKSLNIVNLHRVMTMLKLKINVNCCVLSFLWLKMADFERFGGFCVDC